MVKFRIGRILAGVALVASLSLGGCSDKDTKFKEQSVELLYNEIGRAHV